MSGAEALILYLRISTEYELERDGERDGWR